MKRIFTLLTLVLLFGNNVFSQSFNHNLSEEELINLRKSKTHRDDGISTRHTSENTPFLWEYVLDNDPDGDELFEFANAIKMSNGNIGVASSFYYRSEYGDFYSSHPAVALISSDGEEIARNTFFRPGYTSTSTAPYIFEKDGNLFALSTYSPEHDFLSFNYFKNYDNPPTDAILALYKLDEGLNLLESYEHHFPIDTLELIGNVTWEFHPNELSGNLFLFSAFEEEGNITGAYFKAASVGQSERFDSLFFFKMNFDGEIIATKGYEKASHGGWYQAFYRRNQIVSTDTHYILYEYYDDINSAFHGAVNYYDKEFNFVETKYIRHLGYNNVHFDPDPLYDISVVRGNNGLTYLSTTASCIQNPNSYYFNDCRLYKLNDDIDASNQLLGTNDYIIRGYSYTRELSPLMRAIDTAPDSTLYFACNYDVEGEPYSVIEHIDADMDTISTLFYDRKILSLQSTKGGSLLISGYGYITKFPASLFGFEDTDKLHEYGFHHAVAYPNPGCNVLNIRTGLRNAVVTVYDMQGRKIHEQEITDDVTSVDASNWQSGTYVWKLGIRNEELGMKEVESGKWIK